MEPLRGGTLAEFHPEDAAFLEAVRPGETAPGWAFRFLQGLSEVTVVLSGMSTMEQLRENVALFGECALEDGGNGKSAGGSQEYSEKDYGILYGLPLLCKPLPARAEYTGFGAAL